jgi:hypothetical protein
MFNLLNSKTRILTSLALLLAADFLFAKESNLGWVVGVFYFLLLAATIAFNYPALKHPSCKLLAILALLQSLAMVESPDFLNILIFIFCLTGLALSGQTNKDNLLIWAKQIVTYIFIKGWLRLPEDFLHFLAHKTSKKNSLLSSLMLPIGLTATFILLFYLANPLIAQWFGKKLYLDLIIKNLGRMVFWGIVLAASWAMLAPKINAKIKNSIMATNIGIMDFIFSPKAILYSLIIFNLLFLGQNLMDLAFIWNKSQLPEGLSYAHYAHQGACPLIFTSLLAAAFVLIALKTNQRGTESQLIKYLLYFWVGQNIFLAISGLVRLLGYIDEFGLTYSRLSTFIWISLVFSGLLLIIYRLYFGKNNQWLINANLVSLLVILYLASLLNFGGIIANFNVKSYKQSTASDKNLDVRYLACKIGVEALPALLTIENYENGECEYDQMGSVNYKASLKLKLQTNLSPEHWRRWTFRQYRIAQKIKLAP